MPAGYDWAATSAVQGVGPAGYPDGNAWGVFQHPGCNTSAAGSIVDTRNIAGWVFWAFDFGAGWTQINAGSQWCGMFLQTTVGHQGNCIGGNSGPSWTMPAQAWSVHWASAITRLPAGAVCALTVYEARYRSVGGSGPPMADAGWDWRRTSNPGDIRAGGVGRYHLLRTDWQWLGFSTCPESVIRTFVP